MIKKCKYPKNGSTALSEIISAGDGTMDFLDLPFTSGAFEASIAYESIFAQAAEHAAELVQVAGVQVAQALDKASVIAPPLLMAADGGHGGGPSNPVSGANGNIPNPPMDIIDAMQPISDAERAELTKYTGLATHNGHPVIPPFEHTWVATSIRNGTKISGFHQDRFGYYRELGLIKDVEIMAEDFYTAKVLLNGEWIERSYFPERWLPDELMECFYDVIKNADNTIPSKLRTTFEKTRPSGIKITVVIENTGEGVTFFPNLRAK